MTLVLWNWKGIVGSLNKSTCLEGKHQFLICSWNIVLHPTSVSRTESDLLQENEVFSPGQLKPPHTPSRGTGWAISFLQDIHSPSPTHNPPQPQGLMGGQMSPQGKLLYSLPYQRLPYQIRKYTLKLCAAGVYRTGRARGQNWNAIQGSISHVAKVVSQVTGKQMFHARC